MQPSAYILNAYLCTHQLIQINSLKKFSLGISKKNQLCYTETENQVQVNIQLEQNSELYMKEKERCLEVCFLSMVPLMTE